MTETLCGQAESDRKRPVLIEVNTRPVKIDGPRATGLAIKRAAIDDGVKIELDFHLSVLRDDGKEDPVDDDKSVEVCDGLKFFAVDGDDNS